MLSSIDPPITQFRERKNVRLLGQPDVPELTKEIQGGGQTIVGWNESGADPRKKGSFSPRARGARDRPSLNAGKYVRGSIECSRSSRVDLRSRDPRRKPVHLHPGSNQRYPRLVFRSFRLDELQGFAERDSDCVQKGPNE